MTFSRHSWASVLLLLLAGWRRSRAQEVPVKPLCLWYAQPAANWPDALPMNMNRLRFFSGIPLATLAAAALAQTNLHVAAGGSAEFKSVQTAIMAVSSGSRENPVMFNSAFGANRFDLQYGEAGGEKLLLDAHVPAGDGKFPVLLMVHGGGWCAGDKEADIVPVLAPAVTNFTWFTINYRLAPTNRWPACFEDVQTAIRLVKRHAREYKGDPNRIALIGYSAGGHLVCLAATGAEPDTRVQAVVGLAPPTDIVADAKRRTSLSQWSAMANLLGRETGDEATLKIMREISPTEHLHAALPPFLLVQGDADMTVPYKLTQDFAAKLQNNHVSCDFITVNGAQHRIREWNKFHPGWATEVAAWLERHLEP